MGLFADIQLPAGGGGGGFGRWFGLNFLFATDVLDNNNNNNNNACDACQEKLYNKNQKKGAAPELPWGVASQAASEKVQAALGKLK